MPIFEFKCMQCEAFIEKLVMNDEEMIELCCPECESGDLERVLSTTNFAIPPGGAGASGASTETRTCSSGSCTTYNLPGHE
ncbi:MAG: zinc ribbon domain-containing protein [Desulfosarcinaceae bacterium]|nr:zinc ribbon domain-containing protein [Desulfosarcinaceae bacterium]